MKYTRQFVVEVEIDTTSKVASSSVTEIYADKNQAFRSEYLGQDNVHFVIKNDRQVINLETFKECVMHVLKFPSVVIFKRYQDEARSNHFKSRSNVIK